MNGSAHHNGSNWATGGVLITLSLFALMIYSYATLRYQFQWGENDSMILSLSIHSGDVANSILNSDAPYGNGVTFPAMGLIMKEITGASISTLQYTVFPLFAIVLPLIAFVTYRLLTQNEPLALLSTFLLFLQPDFIFVTWRGSHEKFTWALALLLMSLLVSGVMVYRRRHYVMVIIPFYIVAFAFISSNAFFASSFISALMFSAIGGGGVILIKRWIGRPVPAGFARYLWRILYLTLICGIGLYLFFFYLYPPSLTLLAALKSLVDGLHALFLNIAQPADASNYVSNVWVDNNIYLFMLLPNLFLIALAGIVWIVGAVNFMRRRDLTREDIPRLYLWMLFAAFSIQLIGSLVADQTDALGSNMQVRIFTPTIIIALPLASFGIGFLFKSAQHYKLGYLMYAVLTAFAATYLIFSVFKATNEPVVSNKWLFILDSEQAAIEWALNQDHDDEEEIVIWSGFDERIQTAMVFARPEIEPGQLKGGESPPVNAKLYFTSVFERARWDRLGHPQYYIDKEQRIYDNGDSQIYYRRPQTIYQR